MKFQPACEFDWTRALISVALLLMMATGGSGITSVVTGQVPLGITKTPYQDYGLSALGINDRISFSLLEKATGNNFSMGALQRYIRSDLLNYDVRRVLLDVGWGNYTVGRVPHEAWVDNWLSACDSLGVGNVLFVGQLTEAGIDSPWVSSLINADPSAQTYFPDGRPASYVSPDNPDVTKYLEHDLATLYSFYGSHVSWIGIGTGSGSQDPYYNPNTSMPTLGYSNATLANFANSKYFAADISSAGYDSNGVLDSLWAEFRNLSPSTQLSSGNWQLSLPVSVYGNATAGNSLAMRFYLPSSLSAVQVEWYGSRQTSSAGSIAAEILSDSAGKLVTSAVVSSQIQTSNTVTQTEGWQGPLLFRGNFSQGYYWLHLTSPSTSKSNSYQVFVRNYPVDSLKAQSLGNTTSGRWSNIGQTILWLKSINGTSLAISPYEQPLVQPRAVQSFTAGSSFAFNAIYLFLSDRHFNPTNGTITVTDATLNKTVDTGLLSQALNHGLQNWIPIPLDHTLVAQTGHKYVLTITEPRHGISWIVVLRGLTASPSEAGFQGQSQFWLFRLALLNWGMSHLDFTADVSNGLDAVTLGHPDAISFTAPSSSSSQTKFSGLSVLMQRTNPSGSYYPSTVNMTVSIHTNNQTAGVPIKKSLRSMTVPGSSIPQRGWFNVTGFNLTLSSGITYWAIFSTTSQGVGFPMARLVSPYNLKVLGSGDGGSTWSYPVEGPTEFGFVATFSDGRQVGNFIQDVPVVKVDGTNFFAQPLLVPNAIQVAGVFVGPVKGTQRPDDFLAVSINPGDGGQPSGEALAEGRLYSGNITLNYGLQFVQFSSIAKLEGGHEYWIVIRGAGGVFGVEPVLYSNQQPGTPSPMVSQSRGYGWAKYSNLTAVLSYRIEMPTSALPTYGTQVLYGNLARYHNVDSSIDPTAGWNSYVRSLEIQREVSLTDWFRNFSNLSFDFYGTGQPSILTNLHPQGFISMSSDPTISTCQELKTYLLSIIPSNGHQFPTVENLDLLRTCNPPTSNNLLGKLNYVKFPGPQYGVNSGLSVLVLGDTPSNKLTGSLLVSYNTTYVDFQSNPETAVNATLRNYKVIVVVSSSNPTKVLIASLEGFVQRGGVLVNFGQLPLWLESYIADHSTTGQGSTIALQQKITFWTENTSFFNKLKISSSNGSMVASGNGLALTLTPFGRGEVVSLNQAGLNSTLQMSESIIVLSNIVGNTFSPNSASPFWYASPAVAPAPIMFSIEGAMSSQLLVWISNPSSTTEHVSIYLNRSYYHLSTAWKVLDLATLNLYVGTGDAVSIGVDVAPMSWAPLYILSNNASSQGDYSSVLVESDFRYPNQALVTSRSPANQSALLVVTMNLPVAKVTLNDQTSLQRTGKASDLLTAPQGWNFDNSTHSLFVKWRGGSTSILRIEYSMTSPTPPAIFPETTFIWLFLAVLAAELLVLTYLRLSNRKRTRNSMASPGNVIRIHRNARGL